MLVKTLIQLELISGILFTLAIPNKFFTFGSFALGLLALIPHFIALEKSEKLSHTLLFCFTQSITVHVLSSFWLGYFKDFAIFTLGASALGTAGIHCLFGFFFHLPKTVKNNDLYQENSVLRFINTNSFKVIWFAAVYTVWEFQKSRGFIGYPWGTLPMTCYDLKLITQIVDTTGVRGITFLFSLFSAAMGMFILDTFSSKRISAIENNKKIFSAILLLFMTGTVYGVFQYTKVRTPVKYMNTIMVQQNYDPWKFPDDGQNIYESELLTLQGVEDFKKQNRKTDLVAWSEGVIHNSPLPNCSGFFQFFPDTNTIDPRLKPLVPFIAEVDAVTIAGGPYCHSMENLKFSNAALLFGRNGFFMDYYAKIHLVPFAEYIPFTDNPVVRVLLDRLIGFSVGWVPGNEFKTFPIDLSDYPGQTARISIPICFEDAYPDIFAGLKKAGTEVFVNITDDSWSLTDAAEYQHFVIAWYRAMEFRTTLLRSTNSGYTMVEDPSGRILYDLPLFKASHLACRVPVYENFLTFYAIFGEWLSAACLIFMIFIAISVIISFNRRYNSIKTYIKKELYRIRF